jgi:hypothetical protein
VAGSASGEELRATHAHQAPVQTRVAFPKPDLDSVPVVDNLVRRPKTKHEPNEKLKLGAYVDAHFAFSFISITNALAIASRISAVSTNYVGDTGA